MKAYQALAQILVAEGVEVVFGLIGGGIDDVVRCLADETKIRYVKVRHEEVAVGMADGYSRATGKIGVAIIDGGPGLANACAPLIAARMSAARLLVVVGGAEHPDRHAYEIVNRHLNQSYDEGPVLDAVVGSWQQYRTPESLSEDVAVCFRHIRLGRGPIALSFHNQEAEMPAGWTYDPKNRSKIDVVLPPPAPADVQAVSAMIRDSKRPLILVGRGAYRADAHDALTALADRAGALLATSLLAKNWFDGDPYCIGVSGGFSTAEAVPILRQADLVVVFGAQLNDYTMGHGQLYKDARFVQVDINSSAFDEYKKIDRAVLGDAKLTAEALLIAMDKIERPDWRGPAMAERIKAIDRWRGLDLDERPGKANERRVVDALDRLAPKDRLLVVDIGLFMGVPAPNITVRSPGDIVFPWQLGRMGVSTHVAAGCAVGRPDRLVTCFVGDGGFMAAVHALDTLRTEKLPMLLVVMDDSGFGAERHIYELRNQKTHVCDYDTPNIVAMAQALGFKAFKVTSGAEMERVLRRNDLRQATTIVHVVMDFAVPATEMDYAIYKSSVPR